MEYSFDQLPKAIAELHVKVEQILKLLQDRVTQEDGAPQILDIEQAAQLLKVKISTVYSKVHKKELPVCKKGNRLFFYKKDLLDYISSGRMLTNIDIQMQAEKLGKGMAFELR